MKRTFLVGLKCVTKSGNMACDCTLEVDAEVKRRFQQLTGCCYDNNCRYELIQAASHIDLELCLQQQGSTEYENAKKIWVDFEIITEIKG